LLIAQAFGGSVASALDPACALEFIHTYSLIHDDLPCMDDDDLRRGKPSLHKAFDEATAVLTGDFLLTYAFQVLAQSPLPPEARLLMIEKLSIYAGNRGMIGGQMLDIAACGDFEWEKIHALKTAALFSAAFEFGGIAASTPHLDLLREIGLTFGMAFQLADDLEDPPEEPANAVKLLGREDAILKLEKLRTRFSELVREMPSKNLQINNLYVELL